MKKIQLGLFILIAWITLSCDSNRVYERNIDFINENWHKDSILQFDLEILDSNAVYHVYLNNRISGAYKYSNLYLFVTTELPHNGKLRDTIECVLADPNGKWLGKGYGNIWSNQIPYKKNIRFPYTGKYSIYLEQAMRDHELSHIASAGIRIEKAK